MSDLPAPPRFVALPDGRPLDIIPPSRELAKALRDAKGKPPLRDPYIPGSDVIALVLYHCLGSPNVAFQGDGDDAPLSIASYPEARYKAVYAITATWSRSYPWHYWRVIVERCAVEFLWHLLPWLRVGNPALHEAMKQLEEEAAAADVEAWLTAAAPEAPGVEAPKPGEAPAIDFDDLAAQLRKKRWKNPAKLVEYMASRPRATADEIAHEVHGDDEASPDAIRKNIDRTNEFLEDVGSRLKFRLAADHVFREILPE